jgi:hypothetical protein
MLQDLIHRLGRILEELWIFIECHSSSWMNARDLQEGVEDLQSSLSEMSPREIGEEMENLLLKLKQAQNQEAMGWFGFLSNTWEEIKAWTPA